MTTIPGYVLAAPICETGDLLLYRATRMQDGLPVVLKFPASPRPSPLLISRLEREYELTRDLDSSRIAHPLALERPAGNVLLALEDGPTHTLASLLDSPMDVATFLPIAIGATAALVELHRHELVHKDIKPEHVLLDAAGHVWLTGLGIASRLPREHLAPDPPEIVAGTLAYMAPEQTGRMNRSIDSRSDLYALGVTFYQILTGQLPFTASDPMGWVHCHIALQPPPPSQRVAAIPQPLSEIVMKLMAKSAEDRYQTAAGLKADLERCAAEWLRQGRIAPFPLAARDIPDRLVIPEKLYGREREVAALLDAFNRVLASGKPELVLVSGYSGVGKTAVVNELHKALVPSRGLFAAGKFDQYKRDIPYTTLVQALQILIRQILGQSEAEVAAWRDAIQQAVSPNGRLILSLIPEVELIIGKQPPAPALPPQEARNRFQMVLRRFLGAFAGPEHPLVLFLDDLQWLDAATLDLIEQLAIGQEVRHLLLIAAYRDNEVGPAHPLMRIIEAIRKAETGLGEIVLAPLGIGDVGSLVAVALHCDREHALPLAQLVHEKTGGNPFFVIQFLTALAEEKLLTFDPGAGLWTWDMASIHAKGHTDNVIDLMVGKLSRLPTETLEALEKLACLGNGAEIATLTAVCGQSEGALHAALWEAVRPGLVFRQEKTYGFLHDRVQEAAYALVPENRRKALHLKIGRLLLAQYPQEALAKLVFEVADQFNRGVELVTDAQERETLRRLNAAAGRKARTAAAYASGGRYFEQAMALLPLAPWNDCYAETLALYRELAECEYLVGNFQRADELLAAALEEARATVDLASIHRLRLRLYQISGRYREALEVALEALRLFGVTLPKAGEDGEDIRAATEAEHRLVTGNLRGRRIIDLLHIPPASDAETKALLGLMADSAPPFVLLRSESWVLFLAKAVNICLQRGHSDESAFLYSFYAAALIEDIRKIQTALQFSDLAIELNAQSPGASLWKGRILLEQGIVTFWGKPFATCLTLMEQAFRACLDFGDFAWGGFTAYHAIWAHLENGDPLERVAALARRYVAWAHDIHSDVIYELCRLEQQFALSLQGKTRSLTDFSDAACDEARSVAVLEQAGFGTGIAFYCIMKQMAAFLGEQYDEALESADRAARMLLHVRSQINTAMHCFYRALTMAALHAQAPAGQQRQFAQAIGEILEELKSWADNCPESFANRYFLVSAEMARIEGREMEAMRLYDEAIRSARDNNFVHQEALAAEVASRFYRARGFDRIADAYLRDAHASYGRWGAHGKVRQMEQRHPQLREAPALASAATFRAGAQDLDILAAVRASQAVSGEILFDNLLKTLMRIVLENAGARQGYLVLVRNGEWAPAASARVENQNVAVHLHGDLEFPETKLPASILNYVRRSLDKVLIEDATGPNPYSADEYFSRQRPKSVLCFPIVRQTGLTGLLYLENDLLTHAFTPQRLAVLELLATQAAISLENALSYEALQKSEAKYRRIVDTTHEGIWQLDPDLMTTFVNTRMAEMLGYSEAEMIGRPSNDFLFEEDVPDQLKKMQNGRLRVSETYERRFRRKDGQVLWTIVSGTPILDGDSHFKGTFAMHTDITERKRAEEALLRSEAYLADAQRLSHIGSWAYKHGTDKPSYWSDESFQIWGFDPKEGPPDGDMLRQRIHPEDRIRTFEVRDNALQAKTDFETEFRIVRPDGTVRNIRVLGHPVLGANGELIEVVGTHADVTERMRAEQERERLKQLESDFAHFNRVSVMGELVASIAHEVNQPLAAVVSSGSACLHWLAADVPNVDKARETAGRIVRDGKRAGEVIARIRALTKRTVESREKFDLNETIREVLPLVGDEAKKKSVMIRTCFADDVLPVLGDRVQLQQVVLNLVMNGIEAMSTVDDRPRQLVIASRNIDPDQVEVTVEDSGTGLDPDASAKIFDAFYTTKPAGMGMGLSISRSILQAHEGRLWATPKTGPGTVFHFTLPKYHEKESNAGVTAV
jgi:PAS domain S-box-containing protein